MRLHMRLHESEKVIPSGTPLVEIGDAAEMEIVVELLSTDAIKVQPGATVVVSGWGGNWMLPARVRRIEPGGFTKVSALGIDEQRVRAILDFAAVDTTALGHNYRVYTAITTWRGTMCYACRCQRCAGRGRTGRCSSRGTVTRCARRSRSTIAMPRWPK